MCAINKSRTTRASSRHIHIHHSLEILVAASKPCRRLSFNSTAMPQILQVASLGERSAPMTWYGSSTCLCARPPRHLACPARWSKGLVAATASSDGLL